MSGSLFRRGRGFTLVEIIMVLTLMLVFAARFTLPYKNSNEKKEREFNSAILRIVSKARERSLIEGHAEVAIYGGTRRFWIFGRASAKSFSIQKGRFTGDEHYNEPNTAVNPYTASVIKVRSPEGEAIDPAIKDVKFFTIRDSSSNLRGLREREVATIFFHNGFFMPFQVKFTCNGVKRSIIVDKFSQIKLQ
ncbi:MAG: prepilin-type N-terminal cleavage/methylation domain-containing protein [Puniceicoccales bacterium]|jgi:prepilin-type N-terminal cleavage/methylation domain-containing protein|nr:prepilin-type N-terminal cleavage/methylation domain-containing protein [Puniceicoccales bacterium]